MNIHFVLKQLSRSVALALTFIIIILSLSSCIGGNGAVKTVYQLLSDDEPDEALALIVNNPKEDVISKVEIDKSVTLSDEGDRFLVIPKYKDSILEIWTVSKDAEEYRCDELVYSNDSVAENFVLDVDALRSADEPKFEIVVRTQKYFSRFLLLPPSGEEGEESFEYITADNADYGKSDMFSFDEIAYLFYRGQTYLGTFYGRPSDTHIIERNNTGTATRLFYGNTIFDINNATTRIYRAIMLDDRLPHVRDVRIGDSLPMVLISFPNENDGYTAVFEEEKSEEGENVREGTSYTYQLLYGEFGKGQYGYIKYDAREVVTDVIYVDNGKSVIFGFKNNRVLSIEYRTES
jgi:hypothetical protein